MIDLLLIDSTYVVWLLVPLLPAIVLYVLFPTALVETQWKVSGLAVKSGGAAGLYVLLVALAYLKFLSPTLEYAKNIRPHYWTVDAPVRFVDAMANEIVPVTSSSGQFKVSPYAYDFSKIDQKRYLVTLQFSENSDGELPRSIRLMFDEGEGFIDLKALKEKASVNRLTKKIDLTGLPEIVISPPLTGGQNKAAVAGLPQKLQRDLETAGLQAATR
jgi:hypothetical protein